MYGQIQETGRQTNPDEQPIDWFITGLAFLFPAVGGALFGYDIGATSGALVSIKSAATSGTDWCVLLIEQICALTFLTIEFSANATFACSRDK